ncbi:TPA: hypothetical protein ACUJC4_004610 [Salmonella enterica]|nr:hypothetical protein [Salmonella enterica]
MESRINGRCPAVYDYALPGKVADHFVYSDVIDTGTNGLAGEVNEGF